MKQIPLRNYYLFALWLPFILPAIIIGIDEIIMHKISGLGWVFLISVIFGGVQYLGFALWAFYRYYKSSVKELERFFLKAPLHFIPICALGILILFIIQDISRYNLLIEIPEYYSNLSRYIISSALISLFVIPYGYFYLSLTHIFKFVLKKLNIIKCNAPPH